LKVDPPSLQVRRQLSHLEGDGLAAVSALFGRFSRLPPSATRRLLPGHRYRKTQWREELSDAPQHDPPWERRIRDRHSSELRTAQREQRAIALESAGSQRESSGNDSLDQLNAPKVFSQALPAQFQKL